MAPMVGYSVNLPDSSPYQPVRSVCRIEIPNFAMGKEQNSHELLVDGRIPCPSKLVYRIKMRDHDFGKAYKNNGKHSYFPYTFQDQLV